MNPYLKGHGDFDEPVHYEPSLELINIVRRDNAREVSRNTLESFGAELLTALHTICLVNDADAIQDVLDASARDLILRGVI